MAAPRPATPSPPTLPAPAMTTTPAMAASAPTMTAPGTARAASTAELPEPGSVTAEHAFGDDIARFQQPLGP